MAALRDAVPLDGGDAKVQPLVKGLQAKFKSDPQALNAATMALYKEHKVNPLAGCFPMLIQFPILIGLFWAIQAQISSFSNEHWLWIGSPFAQELAKQHKDWNILGTSLATPDVVLLVLYVISMYFTVRYGSPPSTDPQQAQTQKIMAIVSPAMIAFFGFKYQWASALYIYWLATNVFTVAQQYWLFRRYGSDRPQQTGPCDVAARCSRRRSRATARPDGKKAGNTSAATNGKRRLPQEAQPR